MLFKLLHGPRFLFLLCLFCAQHTYSQIYPVQLTVAVQPPISNKLNYYSSSQALQVQLLHKDFATPNTDVYLECKIEGTGITIQTRTGFKSTASFALQAGIPYNLDGSDITDVLDPNNLDFQGIEKVSFLRNGTALPEGIYRFSFRALDVNTSLPVSSWGSAMLNVFGNLPPVINVPVHESEVQATEPQQLVIQFTPRHSLSPDNAEQIQYKVRLVELIPATRNPNEAMQSTQVPLFEDIVSQTTCVVGADDPQLVVGRSYALQVQAIDASGFAFFENEGNSQVVSFVYGSRCQIPDSFRLTGNPGASVTLDWSPHDMHRAYLVQYRKKGGWTWSEDMVFQNSWTINTLMPKTQYEFRLNGVCAESQSAVTPILTWVTDSIKGEYAQWARAHCGKPLPSVDLSNRKPLLLLQAGDKIKAADFTVTVLSSRGQNGRFDGTGTVLLPFTGKVPIPCSFQGIVLNSDKILLDGKIQLLRKPLELSNRRFENLSKTWNEQFGKNWNQYEKRQYSGTLTDIKISPDGIELHGSSGKSSLSLGKNYEITDAQGNRWFVSAGGKVSKAEGPIQHPPIVAQPPGKEGIPNQIKSGISKVFFTASTVSGYDGYEVRDLTAGLVYDKLECADTTYISGYKLLKAGETDTVFATIVEGRKQSVPLDSVFFARNDGTLLPFVRDGNAFKIPVTGRLNLHADAVWAFTMTDHYKVGGPKRIILGKINIIQVDRRLLHVKLVPVNGIGTSSSASTLEEQLQELTGGQGLDFRVTLAGGIQVAGYDAKKSISVERSVLNTAYSADLGEIIREFEGQYPRAALYQGSDTAWMFLLGAAAEQGYMGLARNYGFVFLNGAVQPTAHTLAHEIGHGLLNLEHTFEAGQEGSSQNLMDYSPPFALLNKEQWVQVFDGEKALNDKFKFQQSAKRGKLIQGTYFTLSELKIPTTGAVSFVAPDGKPITLLADSIEGVSFTTTFVVPGTNLLSKRSTQAYGILTRLRYMGVDYSASINRGVFLGYRPMEFPMAARFDSIQYYPYAYSNTAAVYAGYEDTTCRLVIRSGNYSNSNKTDTVVTEVVLTGASEVHSIELGEDCLEYFQEESLTPAARRWWKLAQLNVNFTGNREACRRIVRLINDLGDDYKYFDIETYRSNLAAAKLNQKPPFPDAEAPFTKDALRGFENYLRGSYYALTSHEELMIYARDPQALGEILSTLPAGVYEQMSLKMRMKLLRILASKGLTNFEYFYPILIVHQTDNEVVTLQLMKTMPESQISDFLDSLISPVAIQGHAHFLAFLSSDVVGLDGDEYYEFASWIFKKLMKYRAAENGQGLEVALENDELIAFNPGLFNGTLDAIFKPTGEILFESQALLSVYTQKIVKKPYDWIYVKFLDEFKFGELNIPKHYVGKFPAIVLSAIFEQENLNDWKTATEVAVDVVLMYTGIGEVKLLLSAGNYARKAWLVTKAVVDLGFGMGDIAIKAGLGDVLDDSPEGRQFLNDWNTIQMYYGIGSLAETGLNKIVYKLYRDHDVLVAAGKLDPVSKEELEAILEQVEANTGLLRLKHLKKLAGRMIVGEKNLIQAEIGMEEFVKLRRLEGDNIVAYSARDFWMDEGKEYVQYLSNDAKFLIKHDPKTGRMLVADIEEQSVIHYSLDEDGLFQKKYPTPTDAAYEDLMIRQRTILGVGGGLKEIAIRGRKFVLSQDKANVLLGKWKAQDLPGIEGEELGTDEIMEYLLMFKHSSYKNANFELRPGSIHILNIPDGNMKKSGQLIDRIGDFWVAYNKAFLEMIVQNKNKVNVVLASDPRKKQVLFKFENNDYNFNKPTIFHSELQYLKNNGIMSVNLHGLENLDLNKIL